MAQRMSPEPLNHALTMWDVDGELDAAVMCSAFRFVLDEAEVLRVDFVDGDDGLRLVPRELGDWRPFQLDLSTAADPEQAAREALADLVRQPFDLERDILVRLGVVRLAATRSLVVIAYHHLVSDGFGAGGLLSRRLAEVYTALVRQTEVPEPRHPWDAESFAAMAAEYAASEQFAEDTGFWRDYLTDAPPPARLPRMPMSEATCHALGEPMSDADRWSEVADAIGMVSRTLTVPRAEADTWAETAKSMGVWMSSLLTTAAAVFFRHRCEQPEFVFSLAVGNRIGVAGTTPGLAVNVVPVRARVPLGATFSEVADALSDETYEIFDHTACHYSDIQRASATVLSGRGSFGTVLNIVEFVEQLHFADSPARYFAATTGAFDELSIGVCTDGTADSDLFLRLDAPAGLYSRAELRVIGQELIAFVRAVLAADPRLPIGALDVLGGAERDRVLRAPHDTDAQVPGLTVPELFARQVARAPDDVAVVCGEQSLSYREVDTRSDRLATALRRRGVGPETVVAVALPRSADLVVALLGVAKAGGAYLVVDPAQPAERTRSTLADVAARVLLADPSTGPTLAADLTVPVELLHEVCRELGDEDGGMREPVVRPGRDNLLAVLHGAGPSGVAVTHRNLERFVLDRRWMRAGGGTVLWHTAPTSDALVLELWLPLLNGGRVVVAGPGELDVDALTALLAANEISELWLPTGLFSMIAAGCPDLLGGLREVWTGGDPVSAAAVRRVLAACPELTVVTGHGQAEVTVFAACHRQATADGPAPAVSVVGDPMDRTALYVLGPGLAPVPAGVVGELYVAGSGVARGYLGRPWLTAQWFLPCPFGPAGGLMYRTGDRVRRDADGRLEYVGRADDRALVRGVAVESAEIERTLSEQAGVAQSVVVARPDQSGSRRLVAYVVPARDTAAGAGLSAGQLRRFAAGRLPEFMVPSVFVVLERLPVTAGGRLDRASLPEPQFRDGVYRAPRNDTEVVLAEAFADALDLDRVGIDEDFFELGGNSLRAIRLVGLIRSGLSQEVSIRALFAARSIVGLSDMWNDLARSSRPALRRRTRDGEVV